jgi:splicing factor 3B subunit 3
MAGFSGPQVKILSLEPESCFKSISTQALPGNPTSVSLVEITNQLYLHVGIENKGVGTLLRTTVDAVTGDLSDSRS